MSAGSQAVVGLVKTLASLRVGEPLIFLLVAEVDAGYPPLLVQPVRKASNGERLLKLARQLPGAGEPFVTGRGSFDDHGRLHLQGAGLDRSWLERLAAWTRLHVATEPKLGILFDAHLAEASAFDGPPTLHADTALWDGIRPVRPRRSGGHAESAAALSGLPRGGLARFWLTESSIDDPFLVVTPVREDPKGETYARAVKEARARAEDPQAEAISGVVQRLESGRLTLTGRTDPARVARAALDLVLARGPVHPALWELADAHCLRLAGGALDRATRVRPRPDLETLRKVLPQLAKTSSSARAWFTTVSEDGMPRLILARSEAALSAAASEARGPGSETRGTLRWTDGGPEFVCERPSQRLSDHLAGWAVAWRSACPPLATLRSLVLLGPEGIRLHPDAALWAPLET